VVNNAPGPSILIECGFLSNPLELYQLKQEKVQVTTAYAVTMALLQFLGK
jgi:N-acetylmuramoyl-L-alanine amidase